MLREPRLDEPFRAPPEFLCGSEGSPPVDLPLGGRVKPALVHRFVRAMARHGLPVQAARLGYDRLYACECFARAHASHDGELRSLALELFNAFEHRDR